jgi:hypothetical protein
MSADLAPASLDPAPAGATLAASIAADETIPANAKPFQITMGFALPS